MALFLVRAACLAVLVCAGSPAVAAPFSAGTSSMTVLDFARACRANDKACWVVMDQTMDRLRATQDGVSFCLPRALTVFSAQVIYPVALLDTWAQMVMAERFGRAEQAFDDILIEKVGQMYPCQKAAK
jgi:hypothetical protein